MRTFVTQTQQVPICQPSPERKMGSEFTKQLYLPRMQQYDVLFCFSLSLQPMPTHMGLHLLFLKPMPDTQCHSSLCLQHISFHECFYLLQLLLILDLRCLTLCLCPIPSLECVYLLCFSPYQLMCVCILSASSPPRRPVFSFTVLEPLSELVCCLQPVWISSVSTYCGSLRCYSPIKGHLVPSRF